MRQAWDLRPDTPAVTGDAAALGALLVFCQQSVSNLSAHYPRDAMRSKTSRRPVSADELGRCGAEHGAGVERVGAALASHGRSHRFDPCHAHQHKQPPSLRRSGRLPEDLPEDQN